MERTLYGAASDEESGSDHDGKGQRDIRCCPPVHFACSVSSLASILGLALIVFCATRMHEDDWKPLLGAFIGVHIFIAGSVVGGSELKDVYFSHTSCIASLGGISGIILVIFCAAHIQQGDWNWTTVAGIVIGAYTMLCGFFFQLEGHYISKYLLHARSAEQLATYVEALQAATPVITFKSRSYHYKTRTSTVFVGEDERGDDIMRENTWETSEKEYTHEVELKYSIQGFTDETMSPAQAFALCQLLNKTATIPIGRAGDEPTVKFNRSSPQAILAACQFDLNFVARDAQTERDFQQKKQAFLERNNRDAHQETSTEFSLVMEEAKYTPSVLSMLSLDGKSATGRNCLVDFRMNNICSCLCLGPLYQFCVVHTVPTLKWDALKHFSCLEPASWTLSPVSSLRNSSDNARAAVARIGSKLQKESGDSDASDESSDDESA
ncbi:unnamed protein product [Polarella glacialis]|uniref:Uncharacterized protein n=1 Tax=Polarella glacialis TaxID=89957 RepID=A0A813JZ29_POLGL|nr:unnamed protein product [Polarella glacialis]CAE8692717.1 unnamed protein product [Polarella glacialis]